MCSLHINTKWLEEPKEELYLRNDLSFCVVELFSNYEFGQDWSVLLAYAFKVL